MKRPRALPQIWLFTDERLGDALWPAIARLPRGHAGVILRHHTAPDRAALGRRLRALTRRHRLMFLVADDPRLARALHADGTHQSRAARTPRTPGLRTATAHSLPELRAAERTRAHLAFVSPVFATRTHPGAPTLGPLRFGLLACTARVPIAALGGMTRARYRTLSVLGATAWGAVNAYQRLPSPSRSAEPLSPSSPTCRHTTQV